MYYPAPMPKDPRQSAWRFFLRKVGLFLILALATAMLKFFFWS